jgi:hypothetical protein
MQVQVLDNLAAFSAGVDNQLVAFLKDTLVLRYLLGSLYHAVEQRHFGIGKMIQRLNMFSRYNQDMYRCLRVQVGEGDYLIVLIEKFTRDFSRGNFTENAIHLISLPSLILCPALLEQVGPVCIVGDKGRKIYHGQPDYGFRSQVFVRYRLYFFHSPG